MLQLLYQKGSLSSMHLASDWSSLTKASIENAPDTNSKWASKELTSNARLWKKAKDTK